MCVQASGSGLFSAEGDLDELEEELKLLLDGGKPGPVSSGPEGPPGVLQPSELLESPPAAPGGAADVCEQLRRLALAGAGRHSAVSLLSSRKRLFLMFLFCSFQTPRRRNRRPDSWRRRSDAPTGKTFICTLRLRIRNILIIIYAAIIRGC